MSLSAILIPVAGAKNTGACHPITLGRQAAPEFSASARFLDATGFVASRSCSAAGAPPPDRRLENRRPRLHELGILCRIYRHGMRHLSATTGPEGMLPMPRARRCWNHHRATKALAPLIVPNGQRRFPERP